MTSRPCIQLQDSGTTLANPLQSSMVERPTVVNPVTGMGTDLDKAAHTGFQRISMSEQQAETIYQVSWAAAKLIDIPVQDMLYRGRKWVDDADKDWTKQLEKAWKKKKAWKRLKGTLTNARLHGTGMLIIVPKGPLFQLAQPWKPSEMRKDGLANLWAINRWQADVWTRQYALNEEDFGEPYHYQISPRWVQGGQEQVIVHRSRVLRFDGREAPSTEGWDIASTYDEPDWGWSELLVALNEIHRYAATNAGIAQLVQEASIFTLKVDGFKEAMMGRSDPGEPSAEQLASTINAMKSLYRALILDREDEADRVHVSFGGLSDIQRLQAEILAAIADIPITRFLATSPAGMNATGDSDAKNYAIRVGALQKRLDDPVEVLDEVVARDAGIYREDSPEWKWIPLVDLSPKDQAEIEKMQTEAVMIAYKDGLVDEEEGRAALPEERFGQLGAWTEPKIIEATKPPAPVAPSGGSSSSPPRK